MKTVFDGLLRMARRDGVTTNAELREYIKDATTIPADAGSGMFSPELIQLAAELAGAEVKTLGAAFTFKDLPDSGTAQFLKERLGLNGQEVKP